MGKQAESRPVGRSKRSSRRPNAPAEVRGSREEISGIWSRPFIAKMAAELFVVFIGVTAAFGLDDYRSNRDQVHRQEAVYRALDRELKQPAETHGPVFQAEMTRELKDWDGAIAQGNRPLP